MDQIAEICTKYQFWCAFLRNFSQLEITALGVRFGMIALIFFWFHWLGQGDIQWLCVRLTWWKNSVFSDYGSGKETGVGRLKVEGPGTLPSPYVSISRYQFHTIELVSRRTPRR